MTGSVALKAAYVLTWVILLGYLGLLLTRFRRAQEGMKEQRAAMPIHLAPGVAEVLLARERKFHAAKSAGMKWVAAIAVVVLPLGLLLGVVAWGPFSWGATWVGLLVTRRRARGERVILWLRRFHEYGLLGFRFRRVLQAASRGFGVPITLRDASIKTSFSWAGARVSAFRPLINMAFVVSWIFLALKHWVPSSGPIFIAVFIASYGTYMLLVYALFCSFAFVQLKSTTAAEESENIVENVHDTLGLYDGLVIVRCKDSFWNRTVKCFVDHADVIVIDITNISHNVAWELQLAMATAGPEKIILACGTAGTFLDQLPADKKNELALLVNEEQLSKCLVFTYPQSLGFWGSMDERMYVSAEMNLTRLIATAIAASETKAQAVAV